MVGAVARASSASSATIPTTISGAGPTCLSTGSSSSHRVGTLFFLAPAERHRDRLTVLVKRVYEGIIGYLPIGAVVMPIVLAAGSMHLHHLWHWMDSSLYHEYMVVNGDEVTYTDEAIGGCRGQSELRLPSIANKAAYLNQGFLGAEHYPGRVPALRPVPQQEPEMDKLTGDSLVRTHLLTYRRGALFLVFSRSSAAPWPGTGFS